MGRYRGTRLALAPRQPTAIASHALTATTRYDPVMIAKTLLAALCLGVAGVAHAASPELPPFTDTLRALDTPIRVTVRPGWRAACVNGGSNVPQVGVRKTTTDDQGTVLRADVRDPSGGAGPPHVVQLFFDGTGHAGDIDILEAAGFPLDDETYFSLRENAAQHVPDAEFAGRSSEDIAMVQRNQNAAGPNRSLELNATVTVDGIATIGGEDHLLIGRRGIISGNMEGQDVTIRFAGRTLVHLASGLIAEQRMHTELRSEGANPVREVLLLTCDITPAQ